MASSYNTIGLELMATGENAGTWGDKTNSNLNLIQQAVAGYEAVTITDSATTALIMTDAALSNARNMIIKIATITLTGATTVTIPDGVEKFYIFDLTAVTGVTNLTIKTASGTGFTAGEAKIVAAYSDGTDLKEIALDTLGGTIGSAQIANNAVLSAAISANQVTTVKIADNAITTAKISALQVTGAKIAQSTITAAKLATDSVGPDQLISTGVTAGSYTVASITVDADGRITAASSGSAGSAAYVLTGGAVGVTGTDVTQTFTANPATTKLNILMIGGGGAGGNYPNPAVTGDGGYGGIGYFSYVVTAPFSASVTAGKGGGTSIYGGQAGGTSTFGPSPALFTVNGGGGGSQYAPPPTRPAFAGSGSAPGAYVDLSVTTGPGPSGGNPSQDDQLFGAAQAVARSVLRSPGASGFAKAGERNGQSEPNKGGVGGVFIWENILT